MNELPEPSAELIVIREVMDWYLSNLPRREAERARSELMARFAMLGELTPIVVMRPPKQIPAVIAARKQAGAWFVQAFGPREC